MNIPIITGGKSIEREIAFRSAKNVFNSIYNLGHEPIILDLIDDDFISKIQNYKFAFNVVHGDYGEDGKLPSLLDILGIDYTCSGPETCVATYDKFIFYSLFKNYIQIPKTILTNKLISPPFAYPFIIKPRKSGSSKGVYIIHNENEFKFYLDKDLREFQDVLVQEYIKGREITISYIQKNDEFILLPILEIIPKKEFYDYEAKYTNGLTELIPQLNSPEKIIQKVNEIGAQVMKILSFKDMFRIDAVLRGDEIYVLEINTVPGLTELSDLPTSAIAAGISFDELIDIIIKNHVARVAG
ncbi:D-alanine--D-alanine ligase family protein [Petrotoga olearia]|uniref:D-alanine--D-alanine ligase n=2 Tax=Petrotoga olearia TaxID=156203 RepID=A0A2K1P023_9BACT|nr:ATP-grasp domain-containing protein [Petrotoga olearia]PNR96133.1 D-alanine--D-alanine ligase [Petrotoga olearia DSM 13574]RMA71578.1 D-alanine--D-alanine ligase [Petrotoga olearia]